jgi:hypothetical protein
VNEVPAVGRKDGPDGLVREMARVKVRAAEAMILVMKETGKEMDKNKSEMERVWRQSMKSCGLFGWREVRVANSTR